MWQLYSDSDEWHEHHSSQGSDLWFEDLLAGDSPGHGYSSLMSNNING